MCISRKKIFLVFQFFFHLFDFNISVTQQMFLSNVTSFVRYFCCLVLNQPQEVTTWEPNSWPGRDNRPGTIIRNVTRMVVWPSNFTPFLLLLSD